MMKIKKALKLNIVLISTLILHIATLYAFPLSRDFLRVPLDPTKTKERHTEVQNQLSRDELAGASRTTATTFTDLIRSRFSSRIKEGRPITFMDLGTDKDANFPHKLKDFLIDRGIVSEISAIAPGIKQKLVGIAQEEGIKLLPVEFNSDSAESLKGLFDIIIINAPNFVMHERELFGLLDVILTQGGIIIFRPDMYEGRSVYGSLVKLWLRRHKDEWKLYDVEVDMENLRDVASLDKPMIIARSKVSQEIDDSVLKEQSLSFGGFTGSPPDGAYTSPDSPKGPVVKLGKYKLKRKSISFADKNAPGWGRIANYPGKIRRWAPGVVYDRVKTLLLKLEKDGELGNLILDIGSGIRPRDEFVYYGDKQSVVLGIDPSLNEKFKLLDEVPAKAILLKGDAHDIDNILKRPEVYSFMARAHGPSQAAFSSIVFIDVLNYLDYSYVIKRCIDYLEPGGRIIIVNMADAGFVGGKFHSRGVKSNRALRQFIKKRPELEIERIESPRDDTALVPYTHYRQVIVVRKKYFSTRDIFPAYQTRHDL